MWPAEPIHWMCCQTSLVFTASSAECRGVGRRKGESHLACAVAPDRPGWRASNDGLEWRWKSSKTQRVNKASRLLLKFLWMETTYFEHWSPHTHLHHVCGQNSQSYMVDWRTAYSLCSNRACLLSASRAWLYYSAPPLLCLSPQGPLFPGLLSHSCSWKVSIERMFWSLCRAKTGSCSAKSTSSSFSAEVWMRFPSSQETKLWAVE